MVGESTTTPLDIVGLAAPAAPDGATPTAYGLLAEGARDRPRRLTLLRTPLDGQDQAATHEVASAAGTAVLPGDDGALHVAWQDGTRIVHRTFDPARGRWSGPAAEVARDRRLLGGTVSGARQPVLVHAGDEGGRTSLSLSWPDPESGWRSRADVFVAEAIHAVAVTDDGTHVLLSVATGLPARLVALAVRPHQDRESPMVRELVPAGGLGPGFATTLACAHDRAADVTATLYVDRDGTLTFRTDRLGVATTSSLGPAAPDLRVALAPAPRGIVAAWSEGDAVWLAQSFGTELARLGRPTRGGDERCASLACAPLGPAGRALVLAAFRTADGRADAEAIVVEASWRPARARPPLVPAARRVSARAARAITAACDWLARHQDADGKWDADEFMKHDVDGEPSTGAGNPVHDIGVCAASTRTRNRSRPGMPRTCAGWSRGCASSTTTTCASTTPAASSWSPPRARTGSRACSAGSAPPCRLRSSSMSASTWSTATGPRRCSAGPNSRRANARSSSPA